MIKFTPAAHVGMVLRVIGRIGLVNFFDGLHKALSVMDIEPPLTQEVTEEWRAIKASVQAFSYFLIRQSRGPAFRGVSR